MESTTERTVDLSSLGDHFRLFGKFDQNLTALEEALSVSLRVEGDNLVVHGAGDAVDHAFAVVERMLDAAVRGAHVTPDDVALAASDVTRGEAQKVLPQTLFRTHRGSEIRPKSAGQRAFVESIGRNTLTFGIGPAGTGKTFLAVVMAIRALRAREVARVILSRPAIEAGEKLGFLPGDLKEKVDPYMRPLYDSLDELLDDATVGRFLERGTIEVAPLAYMRGRTLSDAFVILDEAQNATREQLKMFLTRLGLGSKMIANGDITQIDLPPGVSSGMLEVRERFANIAGIGTVELTETDVVRHPLVTQIIRAYAPRK